MKKIFIKLARLLGYEIIDQNNFVSPSLEKELNDQLSVINQKSIILPLGNVKITKKVNDLDIWRNYQSIKKEIIVIDDKSHDKTNEILETNSDLYSKLINYLVFALD